MDFAMVARSIIVFVFLAVTLVMNVDDNLIARLGLQANFSFTLAAAILFTMFLIGRNMYVVATVVCLCLIANMPADFGLNFGWDRDIYAGIMVAVLVQPFLARVLE